MPPAIELHHISKTFTERNWKTFLFQKPRRTKALDDISLSVEKGVIMGLLGPNGAGKTTLIKILATLITADSGHGAIAGLSLDSQASEIRNKIGLVNTNDRSFYWRLTGRDNLDFFATLYNLHGREKQQRIQKVLELTTMEGKADFRFMAYSAGQKQRLAIARAMLSEPDILLLDEATSSLDPIATRRLIDFTKTNLAQKGRKTIVWCTHNLHEADEICDTVTILHQGKIIQKGPKEVIKTLLHQKIPYSLTVDNLHSEIERQADFHLFNDRSCTMKICHISIAPESVPALLQHLIQDGIKIYQCSQIEQSLERVFSEIVSKYHQQ